MSFTSLDLFFFRPNLQNVYLSYFVICFVFFNFWSSGVSLVNECKLVEDFIHRLKQQLEYIKQILKRIKK